MLDVPSLYERNPRTGKFVDEMIPLPASVIVGWDAMELLPGAPVRLTVRSGQLVRLEVIQRPSDRQADAGISLPWYRDVSYDPKSGDHWLVVAAESTDLTSVPDGEWRGEAIGEMIRRNPLGIEGHCVKLSDLFPYRDTVDPSVVPPELGRTPVNFEDLRYWLQTTNSVMPGASEGAPLYGVVWWYMHDPVAQVKRSDFAEPRG